MWGYTCGAVRVRLDGHLRRGQPERRRRLVAGRDHDCRPDRTCRSTSRTTCRSGRHRHQHAADLARHRRPVGWRSGTTATTTPSPDHTNAQPVTWPIAGTTPGDVGRSAVGTPPPQGPRVQSFATEVASGRHDYAVLGRMRRRSLAGPEAGHVPDRVRHAPLDPGPDGPVRHAGRHHCADGNDHFGYRHRYPGVSYNAEVPLLLSEIDPVQNAAVQAAVSTAGFTETKVWSGLPAAADNQTALCRTGRRCRANDTCYPPAVNYTPLYYLVQRRGLRQDQFRRRPSFAATPTGSATTPVTGDVLVRFVNAGLRMHVPAIVGAQTGTLHAVSRILADCGRRQPAAGHSPGTERSVPGGRQDLRRDDQCAGERYARHCRSSIAS